MIAGHDPYHGKAWHEEGFELELDNYDYGVVAEDAFSPPIAALELGLRWLHDRTVRCSVCDGLLCAGEEPRRPLPCPHQ